MSALFQKQPGRDESFCTRRSFHPVSLEMFVRRSSLCPLCSQLHSFGISALYQLISTVSFTSLFTLIRILGKYLNLFDSYDYDP